MSDLSHAIAGSLGGSLSMVLSYPLEQLRTRMQAGESLESILRIGHKDGEDHKYDLSKTLKAIEEMYRGCRSVAETVFVSNFLYFYLFNFLRTRSISTGTMRLIEASTVAGVLNVLLTEPLWKANTCVKLSLDSSSPKCVRFADQGTGQRSVFSALFESIKNEGLTAQWRGISASIWLVSNPIIQFVGYESIKKRLLARRNSKALTAGEAFMLGALSKAIATVLTYPLQVGQTRTRVTKAGLLSSLALVFKNEGATGLFAGLVPKLSQTVINSAIQFLLYETILDKIRK